MEDYYNCADILALHDLTLDKLYLMNPSVGPDCAGLETGTYYCVSWFPDGYNPEDWGYQYTDTAIVTGISTSTATATTTPGSTTAAGDAQVAITTPAPYQKGMVYG